MKTKLKKGDTVVIKKNVQTLRKRIFDSALDITKAIGKKVKFERYESGHHEVGLLCRVSGMKLNTRYVERMTAADYNKLQTKFKRIDIRQFLIPVAALTKPKTKK